MSRNPDPSPAPKPMPAPSPVPTPEQPLEDVAYVYDGHARRAVHRRVHGPTPTARTLRT